MLFDWFTVAAQVVNFLILIWLLKHFLYGPILDAIDAREKMIATKLADADQKEAQAHKERTTFQQKNEALDQQREECLNEAIEAAQSERRRLLAEARQAAENLSASRQEALNADLRNLNQVIVRRIHDEVFAIARKTLNDLATLDLEECMVAVFVRHLRELDDTRKAELSEALAAPESNATIRSVYPLPDPQRAVVHSALNETFGTEVAVRYETAPDLISGIELTSNGRKLAWSIADYLSQLRIDLDGLTNSSKSRTEAVSESHAQGT